MSETVSSEASLQSKLSVATRKSIAVPKPDDGGTKTKEDNEIQLVPPCLCKHPLYVTITLAKDIMIKIESGITKMLLKLNDVNLRKFDTPTNLPKLLSTPKRNPGKIHGFGTSLIEFRRDPQFPEFDISEEFLGAEQIQVEGFHRTMASPRRTHPKSMSSHYGLTFGNNPTKVYNFGERGSGTLTRGPPQDFYRLKAFFISKKWLFEDPEFPADNWSIFIGAPIKQYEWKRPHELVRNPKFFVDGYSRFDIQQGDLGDCWLLAATANLTLYPRLFEWVIPEDQHFDRDYTGIFHFRFWYFGRWVDVCIDDRLPTYEGHLAFLHSTEQNEFWSALLEKAYAKLNGSYDALKGGTTAEAMEDFTGGLVEFLRIKDKQNELYEILTKAYERATLMGCSMEPFPGVIEARTPDGLIRGHAYSITKLAAVPVHTNSGIVRVQILRLRNPWGNELEWTGPWSDGAAEWKMVTSGQRNELGLNFEHDGEFWMCFSDFVKRFDRIEMCNMNPDSLSHEDLVNGKKTWDMSVYEGGWVKGCTAGGCRNFLSTFWRNPQYRIILREQDERAKDGKCTVIIALMQKFRRKRRTVALNWLTIGYSIYHLAAPDRLPRPLDINFFGYNPAVAKSPAFVNTREICGRFKLSPGTYCIVPSTFGPNEEGEFLLRVFSEKQSNMHVYDQEVRHNYGQQYLDPTAVVISESDEMIRNIFSNTLAEEDEIDWLGLKTILERTAEEGDGTTFSKDICRSMIAMVDYDRSGKLNQQEFKVLYNDLQRWRKVFDKFDVDNSKTLSGFELREAMHAAGYTLNNAMLNLLVHRYGNENNELEFDDFITCAIKLKTMIELFEHKKYDDRISLSLEDWIESTLYT